MRTDAAHLHAVLHEVLDPRPGRIVVAAYDTELFGHWWFEGVSFLEVLLRAVAEDPTNGINISMLQVEDTPSLAHHPHRRRPVTPRGDTHHGATRPPQRQRPWRPTHASWITETTRPLWQTLREAEQRARGSLAGGRGTARQRAQVARELAQLQASDWPFMITRGSSPDYARDRISHHAAALHRLCDAIDAGGRDEHYLAEREALVLAPREVGPLVSALDSGPPGGG